ncbi:SitI3 family protein [Stigmatella erecta]|uniref:Uncharacterized protein n=1 Tax=Stigmatella erecta TaxID=83460 RepID=A0A1I0IQM6_9BACT|nr:SitI3 family protein [Stigmatella erecta]SET99520.1 hypothetical protein SAMN05443639_106220 [Stigmatella erecta]
MSLDYRFSIASALEAQELLKLALAELHLTPEERLTSEGEPMETQGPGFLVSAGPTSALEKAILQEGLSIEPTAALSFSIDKFSDRARAVTAMLQAGLAVLRHVPGDAGLVFNGETVLLLRQGGHLFLDARTGLWTPERLKLVNMPYTQKDFPVL